MGKAIIEYAGYRAPRTTNWDKVIGDVGEDITGVVTKREKQREEDFKIQQETESAINDFSTGVSQDFSDYVSRGVEANRDVMMKYTKMLRNNEINSTQYKRLMNRVNSDWQQFGQFSKDFETRLADMEKRRQAGDSSVIETWNGERIASAADFKNKQLVPNASSGGLYSISYGADGKPKKTEIIHMNELNNFRGQLVNRVNLQDQIKNITDKAGNFKSVIATGNIKTAEGLSKRLAEEDPELLTEYNNLIDGVYNSVLTGPPNQIASALADNSLNSKGQEYFIYKEGDLDKGGKFEGRDAEDGIKMVQETDGTWGGSLTDNQKELLKKKSKEIADVQLGFEEAYMDKARDYEKELEMKLKNAREIAADKNKAAKEKARIEGYWKKKLEEAKIKKDTKLKPYTEVMSMFEDQDASRIKGNKNVEQANFNENGELEVKMKGQDGVKTYSTDTNEGQISIARLLYPTEKEKLVDENFYADKESYKGETSEIKGEEVIVIGADDLNQEVGGSDYTFEEFIDDDWGDDADKKVGYLKEVAFQTGILNESDVNNLDIEVVKKGSDDDFMKITYTMSDGRVIESETLDNDPGLGKGKSTEENQKVFENFLQELRTELYFKGDETQSGTDVDENL